MVIDGRKIAKEILNQLRTQVAGLPFQPVFCDVLVGDNPVSAQYVRMKGRAAEKIGIKFLNANFPADISAEELILEIQKLNQYTKMCGLIIQLPLPKQFGAEEKKKILDSIDPKIDVDCTGEANTKLFYEGKVGLEFPTAAAVMAVLDSLGINFGGKKILVLGRGELVGRPVSYLLQKKGLDVIVGGRNTENLSDLIKNADVLISATGQGRMLKGGMIKAGSVVVDVGTSESGGGIVGDVDFESVSTTAGFLSPVPGGVGPVTVAMLLKNVVKVAQSIY